MSVNIVAGVNSKTHSLTQYLLHGVNSMNEFETYLSNFGSYHIAIR